jgi:hypothetical protein
MAGREGARPKQRSSSNDDSTAELPPFLTSPARRKEVERLTEQLVEVLIEMMDLVDGEPEVDESDDNGGF